MTMYGGGGGGLIAGKALQKYDMFLKIAYVRRSLLQCMWCIYMCYLVCVGCVCANCLSAYAHVFASQDQIRSDLVISI